MPRLGSGGRRRGLRLTVRLLLFNLLVVFLPLAGLAAFGLHERQLLEDALQRNRFNQRATAAALNLSYDQLRHALKRHKLQDSAA